MNNEYASDPYVLTMIANMPEKTGKSLDEWYKVLKLEELEKHGEIMTLLKKTYGMSHGYANTIALLFRQKQEGGPPSDEALIEAQYEKKQDLLPIYKQIIQEVTTFGEDIEVAPKKTYVSLRRGKQFAIIQPSTKTRLDLGLNLEDDLEGRGCLIKGDRWNGMCTHHIELKDINDLSPEVFSWLKNAYNQAV
jgi:predicted transport protein